jgi:hypothetical protein
MLNPGSKGWIDKYFSLVREGEIDLSSAYSCGENNEPGLHLMLGSTGIIFGVTSHFLFIDKQVSLKWTVAEKLRVLYLESLLLVYIHGRGEKTMQFNSPDFFDVLSSFYQRSEITPKVNFMGMLGVFKPNKLESIIDERTSLPLSIDPKIWVNFLQNSLVFIDVLQFREYLKDVDNPERILSIRKKYSRAALTVLILAAHSAEGIDRRERGLFELFLASADLSEKERTTFKSLFKSGAQLEDVPNAEVLSSLFRKYLLDLAIFASWSDSDFSTTEHHFLQKLTTYLGLGEHDLNESFSVVESFVLENQQMIPFLRFGNSYEQVFSRLSDRWALVIMRNRDKLTQEIKESRELVYLVRKSAVEELTKEEKEKVKTQFKDIIRGIPALTIFMLPGGAILLPLILKIIPSLLPSAFRDNEIAEENQSENRE